MIDPARSRPFSVYLLKEGYDATNSLTAGHRLSAPIAATNLPPNSVLHVFDGQPREPWWRLYFGVPDKLQQATKAALLFVKVKGRTFVLCYGNTAHNLEDESFEYDFGLRVTLNCVDPEKLKNTDVSEPGAARRQRTQTSVGSDLTFFDFESDTKVLRSLTGAVKPAYESLLKNVTGSSNVRFTSKTRVVDIPNLCQSLLDLYERTDYLTAFPDVQNITPVRDPAAIGKLDDALVATLSARSTDPLLSVPELVDHNDSYVARFGGEGPSLLYQDIYLNLYYEYLDSRGFNLAGVDRDTLGRHKLELLRDDGSRFANYPIYKCLVFDATISGDAATYHLMEGNWYRFDSDYVTRITNALEPLLAPTALPDCARHEEKLYNEDAAASLPSGVLLDRTNISPKGSKQVEPCDVLHEDNGAAVLTHVKMSTASSELSHLFNQGANSLELIRSDDDARAKLDALIDSKAPTPTAAAALRSHIEGGALRVDYAIVTHKPASGGINNLPLFSRISLTRAARSLKAMGIGLRLSFVPNVAPDRPGIKKERKPRSPASE
jgi:uncharacterized protein (TIGR04141 family)